MNENWFKQKESVSWLPVAQTSARMGKGVLSSSLPWPLSAVPFENFPPPTTSLPRASLCLPAVFHKRGGSPGSTHGEERPLLLLRSNRRNLAFHWLWCALGPNVDSGCGYMDWLKPIRTCSWCWGVSNFLQRGRMGVWTVTRMSRLELPKGSSLDWAGKRLSCVFLDPDKEEKA